MPASFKGGLILLFLLLWGFKNTIQEVLFVSIFMTWVHLDSRAAPFRERPLMARYCHFTLFKIIKSPQWNCHTSIPTLSIYMHLSNVKIDHMTKFCWHPRSKGQKMLKIDKFWWISAYFWLVFGLLILDADRI